MAKSKQQKREEALVRAKEHYRETALPEFLEFQLIAPTMDDFELEFGTDWGLDYTNRRLATLIRQANLAKVDLDGVDIVGVVPLIQFKDRLSYRAFHKNLTFAYKRYKEMKEDGVNITRLSGFGLFFNAQS